MSDGDLEPMFNVGDSDLRAEDELNNETFSRQFEDDVVRRGEMIEERCEIIDDGRLDEQEDDTGDVGLARPHQGKQKGRRNPPCKVVHIALIPPITRDEDLSFLALSFGEVKMLLYIRKKRHAMICFERQEDAECMVKYFDQFPGELFGSRLSIEFSDHGDLDFPSMSRGVLHTQTIVKQARELKRIAEMGSPGSVLRVLVKSPSTATLTMETLYKIFNDFGVILKIVISKKSNSQEAFIQMKDAESANRAIGAFNASNQGGIGKLEVGTAREHSLNIKFNNARSRDFTNPTLLSSPDVDAQSFIALSANAHIAESRELDMHQVNHLLGSGGFDQSSSQFSRMEREKHRRRPYTGDDRRSPLCDSIDDFIMSKRRRSDYGLNIDRSFGNDSWLNRSSMLDELALDQLLMLTSRNPQPASAALAESLASGRLDGNTIAVAKQILAERAMSAIAQDPYTRLLNTLISSNGNSPGTNLMMGRSVLSPERSLNMRDSQRPSMGHRHSGGFHPLNDDNMMGALGTSLVDDNCGSGRVLLVSNLNAERVNPDTLFTLFGVYGDVQRVRIMFTKSGSALVQMSNAEQAQQAIHYLNGIVLYNKRMRLIISKYSKVQVAREGLDGEQWSRNYEDSPLHRYSRPGSRNCMNIFPPSEQLHLSNISDDTERDELQEIFEKYGQIRNIRFFFTDRRMGVVEMENVSAACEALIGAHNVMLRCNRRLRISFAKPKH